MNYFEQSQLIKKEILESSETAEALKDHLHGKNQAHHLGEGYCHTHHRISQLPSGLWLATRQSINKKEKGRKCGGQITQYEVPRTLNEEIENLEEYCQTAEREYETGKNIVTSFCIGARYKKGTSWRGLILIEDLTKGGKVEISHSPSQNKSYTEVDGKVKRVLFDLSYDQATNFEPKLKSDCIKGIKYFDQKNILTIE